MEMNFIILSVLFLTAILFLCISVFLLWILSIMIKDRMRSKKVSHYYGEFLFYAFQKTMNFLL